MVYFRLPNTGIDAPIKKLQDELHEGLRCAWKIREDEYQCYGRVYKNPVKNGYVPEYYVGDSEFRDVLLDDRFAAQSFFGIGDSVREFNQTQMIADVHIVFFVHLGAIATNNTSKNNDSLDDATKIAASKANPARGDMEARNAVQAILNENLHGFTFVEMITGANVLQEYNIGKSNGTAQPSTQAKGLKEYEMHPFHVFRINGTIRYDKPILNNIYN